MAGAIPSIGKIGLRDVSVNVRFKDNRFSYRGKSYEMPRMGLAVISEFETFLSEDGEVTLSLAANDMTRTHYPFEFVFDVTYRLEGNRLVNEYRVSNNGFETLYFAMGGHPGFRTPLRKVVRGETTKFPFPSD